VFISRTVKKLKMKNSKELKDLTKFQLNDQKLTAVKGGNTILDLLDWSKGK